MMHNNISPETQRLIYQEQQRELEYTIQMRLAREGQGDVDIDHNLPWYVQVVDWLVDILSFRRREKLPEPEKRLIPLPVTGKIQPKAHQGY